MKTVLFVPSNAHHVEIFEPIAKILEKDLDVLFLTQGSFKDEGAQDKLRQFGIGFKKIDDYKSQDPHSILSIEDVGVVVIGNDSDVIPQWFVNCCNESNIPSVLIQDGVQFNFKKSKKLFDIKNTTNFKLKLLALKLKLKKKYAAVSYGMGNYTQMFVWGNHQKKYFTDKGVEKEKISVTGYPLFDKIKSKHSEHDHILYAPSDLVFNKLLEPKDMRQIISDVYAAVSLLDVPLAVKPHPREDKTLFENASNNASLSDDHILKLLDKSRLVISDISSVILEALVAKKPVIVFLPQIRDIVDSDSFPLDLVNLGAVYLAETKAELSSLVPNLLDKRADNSDLLSNYLGDMDGKEAMRCAKQIAKLI